MFMSNSELYIPGIPDLFYSQRIEAMVNKKNLEHQGNLKYMRHCEVRVPKI